MAPNFEAVVSVLLQICGQICRGMPYPCIFVEEVVSLLGEMTDKYRLLYGRGVPLGHIGTGVAISARGL